jgi:hypothetical protein
MKNLKVDEEDLDEEVAGAGRASLLLVAPAPPWKVAPRVDWFFPAPARR